MDLEQATNCISELQEMVGNLQEGFVKLEKMIEDLENNLDKVMLENRELEQRVEKLEGGKK